MKKVLRKVYALTPTGVRLAYNRLWRVRGRVERLVMSEEQVDGLLASTNVFFLLGSGRCGTLMISTLLDEDPEAMVLHEPLRHADVEVRPQCRESAEFALNYVQTFRKFEIAKKIKESGVKAYGEVSSPLRCLGAALKTAIPGAKFYILVRNGADTVRSAVNRQLPRNGRTNHAMVRPLPGDEYYERWDSMSPFEQGCWWWMDAYRTLLRDLPDAPIVQFEKILKDWDYVDERIVRPLGLNVTRSHWEKRTEKKSENAAKDYRVKSKTEWTPEEWATFNRICGEMMQKMGYA